MNNYRIYESPIRKRKIIKDGWSWLAFLFPPIWALFYRIWGALFYYTLFELITAGYIKIPNKSSDIETNLSNIIPYFLSITCASLIIGLMFGFEGYKWRGIKLLKRGFENTRIVTAQSMEGALVSLIKTGEHYPNNVAMVLPEPRTWIYVVLATLVLAIVPASNFWQYREARSALIAPRTEDWKISANRLAKLVQTGRLPSSPATITEPIKILESSDPNVAVVEFWNIWWHSGDRFFIRLYNPYNSPITEVMLSLSTHGCTQQNAKDFNIMLAFHEHPLATETAGIYSGFLPQGNIFNNRKQINCAIVKAVFGP